MSYNIDHVEIVSSKGFGITRAKLREAQQKCGDDIPEINVFDQLLGDDSEGLSPDEFLAPKSFWWSGEWSGHTSESLEEIVLPAFDGEADLVLTWEGGDSVSGLRLQDHKVTDMKVKMRLE